VQNRRFRLGPLLLITQLFLLFFIAGLMVILSYGASRDQISVTIAKDMERARRVISYVFAEKLKLIAASADLMARDRLFVQAATEGQWSAAEDQLYNFGMNLGDQETDVLLIVDSDGHFRGNAGSFVTNEQKLVKEYLPFLLYEKWALIGKEEKYILHSQPITNTQTGEVIGYLIYGISIKGNLRLAHDLHKSTAVDLLVIYAGDDFQISFPQVTEDDLREQDINFHHAPKHTILEFPDDHIGYMSSLQEDQGLNISIAFVEGWSAFSGLETAFRQNLLFFSIFILISGGIVLFILQRFVVKPAHDLALYAESIYDEDQDQPYQTSSIVEFDAVARTIQRVFGDLQQINRNLEERVQERMRALEAHEIRTQAILETAADAIISINTAGIIISANRAVQNIFGHAPEKIIGRNISLLMPENIGREHNRFLSPHSLGIKDRKANTALSNNTFGPARELEGRRANGDIFPIELSMNKSIISDNPVFTGFIRDISDRKDSENALIEARQRAETANQSKSMFLANMSHEIRTPMNAVLGFLQLVLSRDEHSEKTRSQLSTAYDAAESLLRIIDDILDLSKLEAGKFELEDVCFNLPKVARETMQTVEQKAKEKNIDLTLSINSSLPHCHTGDPSRLRQVILNLVGNAIKFTKKGSVHVDIQPILNSSKIQFSIRDTGIGIAPQNIKHIFESFTQADGSTTRQFGGTGLGTTISKQLVDLMGGQIWAESHVGQGSIFYFTAALGRPSCAESCGSQGLTPEAPKRFSPRKFEVLLVEDIPQNIELAKINLEEQGHSVSVAENGAQALSAIESKSFDVILMDVQMPVLDGKTATRQIRKKEQTTNRHCPIIALTASVFQEEQSECFAAGMDYVLSKPIDFDLLFQVMEELVPTGAGAFEQDVTLSISKEADIDFSALAPVIDVDKALGLWRKKEAYGQALLQFHHHRRYEQQTLEKAFAQGDYQSLTEQCHALKGVAGTLAMKPLESAATALEHALREAQKDHIEKSLQDVLLSLQDSLAAIDHLKNIDTHLNEQSHLFDLSDALSVLEAMIQSLERSEARDDLLDALYQKLSGHVPKDLLVDLKQQIEDFEFDVAHDLAIDIKALLNSK